METAPDKEDSRSLFITIHQPSSGRNLTKVRARPILSAKFIFDDYIRCMSAKQRLQRRRTMLRQHKLHCIAQLLELPAMATPPSHYYSITPPAYVNLGPGQSGLSSPADPHTNEAAHQQGSQQVQAKEHAHTSSDTSLESVHSRFAGTMATPEQSLSPVPGHGRKGTSQAEALASVLEQSPPLNTRIMPRTMSVEEAVEAIEMEPTSNKTNTVVANINEQESVSDTSSVGQMSLSESLENIPQRSVGWKSPLSRSAPATPRGDRHVPSVILDKNETKLTTQISMSDPAIFFSGQWNSPVEAKQVEKKSKRTGNRKSRRKEKQRKR